MAGEITSPNAPASGRVSIVLTNWNGKENLERSLPAALRALDSSGLGGAVIVADDASEDGSVEFVRRELPRVRVVPMETHGGFGRTANAGIRAATTPLVALLSNDMVAGESFLGPLAAHFDDPRVFG